MPPPVVVVGTVMYVCSESTVYGKLMDDAPDVGEEEVAVAVDDAEVAGRAQVHLDVAGLDGATLQPAGVAVHLPPGHGGARHEAAVRSCPRR